MTRGDREGLEEQADLLGDDARLDRLDGADFARHLGDHAGDGGDAVDAERAHRLEVGLRAGAGAVVGTGDGEDDGEAWTFEILDLGFRMEDRATCRRSAQSEFRIIIRIPDVRTLTELAGLHVTVDRVVYMPHLDAPPERPHPFVYFITIHNDSEVTVTIKGRKWVVTDADGQRVVVEGDGVVGEFPQLEPGDQFSYNSYHTIGSDSVAEGAFFGVTDAGEPVFTRIPRFEMRAPRS